MNTDMLLAIVVRPALALLGDRFQGADAERMLVAIVLQESGLRHRVQVGGPARGLWQFERGGGVRGVLTHPATRERAARVCADLLYPPDEATVYDALADNDVLAACFARLLLWSDPKPLPRSQDDAWACYQRNWRPGKPHPERWPANWEQAVRAVP